MTIKKAEDVQTKTIRIGKYCANKGCRRVAVIANKVSDFWVPRCEVCQNDTITLDMNKIVAETTQ